MQTSIAAGWYEDIPRPERRGTSDPLHHWHEANLKVPTRVLQLNAPVFFKYSLVYQNVQSSTGSTVMPL